MSKMEETSIEYPHVPVPTSPSHIQNPEIVLPVDLQSSDNVNDASKKITKNQHHYELPAI